MWNDDTTCDAPDNCPDCGEPWSASEAVHTGDDKAHKGWEQWCYCQSCKCELFYPFRLAAPATGI